MTRLQWGALLVAVAVSGCQSYSEGLDAVCNSARSCSDCDAAAMITHAQSQVTNEEARSFLSSLSVMVPDDRPRALRDEIIKAGGGSGCALAAKWEEDLRPKTPTPPAPDAPSPAPPPPPAPDVPVPPPGPAPGVPAPPPGPAPAPMPPG